MAFEQVFIGEKSSNDMKEIAEEKNEEVQIAKKW